MNIKHKGFTLIELLVVIAIIGILASIVLASLNSARKRSRDTRRIADLHQIKTALELYDHTNSTYPIVNTWADLGTALTGTNCGVDSCITILSNDPLPSMSYSYQPLDNNGDACNAPATDCSGYVLKAVLEGTNANLGNDADGNIGGIDCGQDPEVDPDWFYCVKH